jgi:hypothetical protein
LSRSQNNRGVAITQQSSLTGRFSLIVARHPLARVNQQTVSHPDCRATTGISADSIRYYASLVTFYTVYKLRRMNPGVARLYLLCFTCHRFRQVNDRLIEAFIRLVNDYEQTARQAAEEAAQNALTEASTHLKAAGEVLCLFVDGSIPYHAPFASVRKRAFALLAPERFEIVSQYLRTSPSIRPASSGRTIPRSHMRSNAICGICLPS